jgi:UrcA family protein
MSPKTLVLIIASLGAVPFAAGAAPLAEIPTVRVQFADLDISHDAGVERLYSRLRQASQAVCSTHADMHDIRAIVAQKSCAAAALDRAVSDIHSSRLSARHALGAAASSLAMRD